MSGSLRKSVIRQRPRLLYAGIADKGNAWINEKSPAENAELILFTKGSGKAEISGSAYPFTAGDLLICNGGCVHREYFEDTPEKELIFCGIGNLHMYGQKTDTILKEREFCLIRTEEFFDSLKCYFTQLVEETEGNRPLREPIAENLLKIILLCAVRLAAYDENATFNENLNYLAAKKYFDEHYLEIDSIDDVCKSLYINKYYFTHLFSQDVGMPPVKYLINKRINRACELLEQSDDNVADIGKACGYADPCYFSRTFKKVKGVTPLRYRYLFKLEKANDNKKFNS